MNVSALREIALAAQGALAVANCHLQLAKQRVSQEDRITHDHLDTSIVFQDSAMAIISTINEMIQQVEQLKLDGRSRRLDDAAAA